MFKFSKPRVRNICLLAMLTAITAVLAVFYTIRIGAAIKIPLKFISVFVTGALFGPIWGGISAAIGDILNVFLAPSGPWLPLLTLVEFINGFIYGLFFYNKEFSGKKYVTRVFICSILLYIIDFYFTTSILIHYGIIILPSKIGFAYLGRWPASVIKGVMNIAILLILSRPLKMLKKEVNKNFRSYSNSFQAVTRPGLERIEALLEELGNPQDSLKCIHIAGTNGKGSVASFMESILKSAGYRVGKYISPNLIRVNERISINGEEISDDNLNKYLDKIELLSKKVKKNTGDMPTQFEIWTALAFCYFKEKNCDYVVLETGLGGRLDATNIIKQNVLSIITKIDFDHTEYLGNTLEKIAYEKAGIIKKGSSVICAPQREEVIDVLIQKAKEMSAEISFAKVPAPCNYWDIYEIYDSDNIKAALGMGGINQLENASVAVLAAKKMGIGEDIIKKGLEIAKNPARFEKIKDNLIFDGGHNPSGVATLATNLLRYYPNKKFVFIMASMKDKDITENLKLIKPLADEIRFVKVKDNIRSAEAELLANIGKNMGISTKSYKSMKEALLGTDDKFTIVCGSLYLYKDYKEL